MPLIAMALAGCSEPWPMATCGTTQEVIAPDEPTDLGFSAEDAVAWLGAVLQVDVIWDGSPSPPTDTFVLLLGELEGDVTYAESVRIDRTSDPSVCEAPDRLELAREAVVSTDDGGVVGTGSITIGLGGLDLALADLFIRVEATLSEDRWLEVNRALDDSLPPPDDIGVYLAHDHGETSASIAAENSQDYSVEVWRCPLGRGCATWSVGAR